MTDVPSRFDAWAPARAAPPPRSRLAPPPRSRLYRLEPIGIGTPAVESLSSYLNRLAQAHCVMVTTLITHELLPRLGALAPSRAHPAPTPPPHKGRLFIIVDIMGTYALLTTSSPLPPSVALGGSRQGGGFLLSAVLTPPPDGRPGFGQKAALRQGVMAEQRSHQREPATAKDAHQPPLCRPAWAPVGGTQPCHVGQRAFWDRGVDGPTDADHPQGGHGD